MNRLILLLAVMASAAANAQPFAIDWYQIGGSSGASAGGNYQVRGSIGHADAGGVMSGGGFSMTGGFWSLYAVQTPGAPLLSIGYTNSQAIISWPVGAAGWTLQTNATLAVGTWGNYSGQVVNNRMTNPPPTGNVFFRLSRAR